MGGNEKRYHVIISERAGEMLVQHARFLAKVSVEALISYHTEVLFF
jgi:hypothetical protein